MRSRMKNALMVLKVVFARLRFLAVFVVAGFVVGYWDNIRNHLDKWTRPAIAPDSLAAHEQSDIEFYCPMHPQVIRSEPGLCPTCGMPLVKRKKGEAITLPADVLARVQLTPHRVALANVQTTEVVSKPLYREIHTVGVLDYDETKLARLSARVAGRADELFVTYTGQAIKRGDPIYSLYSPEVYTALREYLGSRKRVNEIEKTGSPESRMDATAVYNASLQKLALWGVGTEQLERIEHEFDENGTVPTHLPITSPISGIVVRKSISQGQYLQVGESPYTVADLSRLWLQIKLYERDIPLVNIGDPVDVSVEAFADQKFGGIVAFKAFALDPQTRTLDARVVVENNNLHLRPGMFTNAIIRVPVQRHAKGAVAVNPASSSDAPASQNLPVAYWQALQPYLEVHQRLSSDRAEGVTPLLQQMVKALEPLRASAELAPAVERIEDSVRHLPNESISTIREAWKEISNAMIDVGKAVGVPADEAIVRVHKCPMARAVWLQLGEQTVNPYYGSEMLNCGSPVEALPKADPSAPTTRNVPVARPILAIPRSAVIDTGETKIVYVESESGIYDARAVKVGPIAGGEYPVLEGLAEGDKVVTAGAFLIDAENRINPLKVKHAEANH